MRARASLLLPLAQPGLAVPSLPSPGFVPAAATPRHCSPPTQGRQGLQGPPCTGPLTLLLLQLQPSQAVCCCPRPTLACSVSPYGCHAPPVQPWLCLHRALHPGTHHLPHPVLALHLGPQLHEALLHALVEGPQVLCHLPPVDPDPLCQQRGLRENRDRSTCDCRTPPGMGTLGAGHTRAAVPSSRQRGAAGCTCQAIRSFSFSMFPSSLGCSCR